ncbi:hypothetical protein ABPG74_016581 [Tetrahymena malaccensis]
MLKQIDNNIDEESHPLLYLSWLKIKPQWRFKLYLSVNTINKRLQKLSESYYFNLNIPSQKIKIAQGGIQIGKALSMIKNMYWLNLIIQKHNNIENIGFQEICSGMCSLTSLHRVSIQICENNIFGDVLSSFSQQILNLKSLFSFELKIYKNQVTSSSLFQLLQSLTDMQNLQFIMVHLTDIFINQKEIIFPEKKNKQLIIINELDLLLKCKNDYDQIITNFISQYLIMMPKLQNIKLRLDQLNGFNYINNLNYSITQLTNLKFFRVKFILQESKGTAKYLDLFNNFDLLNKLQGINICFNTQSNQVLYNFDNFFESLKKCNKILEINLQFNVPQVFKLIGLLEHLTQIENHQNFILEKIQQIEFKRDKLTKQIVCLNLTQISNNLNAQQLQALLEGIKQFPNLKKFKYKFSNKSSDIFLQAQEFSKQIQVFEQLEALKLQIEENSKIKEDGMNELFSRFQFLKNLQKIGIDIQFSNEVGYKSMAKLFSQLAFLDKLIQMSLKIDKKNDPFVYGQQNAKQSLEVLKQLKRLKISLYDKEIDQQGGIALQNWIANQQTLQDLEIDIIQTNGQNEIHDDQAITFGKQILNLQNLEKLQFSKSNNYLIYQVEPNQMKMLPKLKELLIYFQLSSEYAQLQLFNFLCCMKQIKQLKLEIEITKQFYFDDAWQLNFGLKKLESLQILDLSINFFQQQFMQFNEDSFKQLALELGCIKNLRILSFKTLFVYKDICSVIIKRKCKRLVLFY